MANKSNQLLLRWRTGPVIYSSNDTEFSVYWNGVVYYYKTDSNTADRVHNLLSVRPSYANTKKAVKLLKDIPEGKFVRADDQS